MVSKKQRIHFIGIGGIGISALAYWYLKQGISVSGSDLSPSIITEDLKRAGAKLFIGSHKEKNVAKDVTLVIYTQAVDEKNPELVKARALKIQALSYPEALGMLTQKFKTIAIAGAHGKSTTTALVSLILVKAKLDPTVIVGTRLKEFNNLNFRLGSGREGSLFVLEADEWRASFLNYHPWIALITNIDAEHLDYYGDLQHVKDAYMKFVSNINHGGLLILNKDNKNIVSLRKKFEEICRKRSVKITWYSLKSEVQKDVKKSLQILGIHNVSNAIGAYTLASHLDVSQSIILESLHEYNGSWRRFELRGTFNGARVYDDYAHHPTEIRATLSAAQELCKKSGKVFCVFQPHQEQRLKTLFKDFIHAFDDADKLVLLDVYEVAGREKSIGEVTSRDLFEAIKKHKEPAFYIPSPQDLPSFLKDKVAKDDIIIMMGAGSINQYTDLLISSKLKAQS